jgi:sensor c-di-GMP phosphodiesterase-like protein
MSAADGAALDLRNRLHMALKRDEFRVYFQPIIDCTTRRLTGFEARFRWAHPTLGLVAPNDFILATGSWQRAPMTYLIEGYIAQVESLVDAYGSGSQTRCSPNPACGAQNNSPKLAGLRLPDSGSQPATRVVTQR